MKNKVIDALQLLILAGLVVYLIVRLGVLGWVTGQ